VKAAPRPAIELDEIILGNSELARARFGGSANVKVEGTGHRLS
jgi:hypothetical protein